MSGTILTVSQLNSYIKARFDEDSKLKNIFVSGEISNFKKNPASGHMYFSLKDASAVIQVVMFRNFAECLRFNPQNGMKVILTGTVTVYTVGGQYQIQARSIQPDGMGALALAYEQLKNKLASEGLFDASHKQELPKAPKKIGVITSASGAVIQDIKNIVSRRYPLTEIVLCPVAVQGEAAPPQLIAAVKLFNSMNDIDVIIIGRGGGSLEDLYCFNDEGLVRSIYDSRIPVISAVGHETDFTLCDFVSDRRAPTPSAAAELAVPDRNEILKSIILDYKIIGGYVSDKLSSEKQDIDRISDRVRLLNSDSRIVNEKTAIDMLQRRIRTALKNSINAEQSSISATADKINALSPVNLLKKGYSVVFKNGYVAGTVSDLEEGDAVTIRMSDGELSCSVESINKYGD